jgi:excisionase family DNA binding protein
MNQRMTITEAAQFLRLSPKTIYSWTSQRKIPHLKVGGRLLFDEAELTKWLEQFKVAARA